MFLVSSLTLSRPGPGNHQDWLVNFYFAEELGWKYNPSYIARIVTTVVGEEHMSSVCPGSGILRLGRRLVESEGPTVRRT